MFCGRAVTTRVYKEPKNIQTLLVYQLRKQTKVNSSYHIKMSKMSGSFSVKTLKEFN